MGLGAYQGAVAAECRPLTANGRERVNTFFKSGYWSTQSIKGNIMHTSASTKVPARAARKRVLRRRSAELNNPENYKLWKRSRVFLEEPHRSVALTVERAFYTGIFTQAV